jgi:glycosyltransferase involved in cell wall biosynthesis
VSRVRIAIVHDALCIPGGAERLVLWMAKSFPGVPIYTSVYLPDGTFPEYRQLDVRTLPFARFIRSEKQFKLLFPLWLYLIQRLDFSDYDVVLSSSTYLAKFITPAQGVKHACYLYAPFRLLWKPGSYSAESLPTPSAASGLVKWIVPLLRRWDLRRTSAIPQLATSCRNMADEIQKVYGRASTILYPPVELPAEVPDREGTDYYLSVSRLISHKRVDLAVKACVQTGRKLVVVGDGPERAMLDQMAGEGISFAGRVNDEQLRDLYRGAKGLIFPSYEDYGIVPLEAQAWGVPVIAYGKGGSLETVQEGVSGIFFERQEVDSLVDALNRFEAASFDPQQIRRWVSRFDVDGFVRGLQKFVAN